MTDVPQLVLRSPADIAAATPYVLGFHPTDSLVLLSLTDGRVMCALRMNLPEHDDGAASDAALAAQVRRFTARSADRGVLIAYGPTVAATAALARAVTVLDLQRLTVLHALRVTGGRVYSAGCPHPPCCPPDGHEFHPGSSVAAAAATVAGLVARPNRDAVAAQVAPLQGAQADAMAAATHRAARRLAALSSTPNTVAAQHHATDLLCRRGKRLVAAAHDVYRGGGVLDNEHAAELSILLGAEPVFHHAVRRITDDDWQLSMWADLTRRAQTVAAAQPANLLTLTALRAGDGTLAACAQQRAAAADPSDSLARTLGQVVQLGIDPDDVARILTDSGTRRPPATPPADPPPSPV